MSIVGRLGISHGGGREAWSWLKCPFCLCRSWKKSMLAPQFQGRVLSAGDARGRWQSGVAETTLERATECRFWNGTLLPGPWDLHASLHVPYLGRQPLHDTTNLQEQTKRAASHDPHTSSAPTQRQSGSGSSACSSNDQGHSVIPNTTTHSMTEQGGFSLSGGMN